MILAIVLLVVILAVLYTFLPLFSPRAVARGGNARAFREGANGAAGELLTQKESLLSALKEIDFDYKTGKLSDEDYHELQESYRLKAIAVMEEIDKRGTKPDSLEAKVEREIEAARRTGAQKQRAATKKRNLLCPSCSSPVTVQDKFCQECGYSLEQVCHNCGQILGKSDKYCSGCGKSAK
ncbi:MAG: zinc ribbon domain-containing protein [Candidatus Tectomicrobia bacterium]|uniref:Zinc ribbon domain-containing protein n=1 Tax=Tectimicrobiota bacterium TaxID=2528274 RepID=A0A933GL91_UNCTE|nr:zinc ribbon domain-containing protein [Candidatus Tectomicrobia bacterium]